MLKMCTNTLKKFENVITLYKFKKIKIHDSQVNLDHKYNL